MRKQDNAGQQGVSNGDVASNDGPTHRGLAPEAPAAARRARGPRPMTDQHPRDGQCAPMEVVARTSTAQYSTAQHSTQTEQHGTDTGGRGRRAVPASWKPVTDGHGRPCSSLESNGWMDGMSVVSSPRV